MSIVSMVKVTTYGHQQDKKPVLEDLQKMGCLHVIPLQSAVDTPLDEGSFAQAREALEFLKNCPQQRLQARDAATFDKTVAVASEALELRQRLQTLEDERDFLKRRIADLLPWGDFVIPPLEKSNGLRFWFYIVPHYQLKQVQTLDLIWEVVGSDDRFAYVAVISEKEPQVMSVARTHTGNVPLSQLQQRLEDVESEIEEVQLRRVSLTRWRTLLARNLARMEDQAALAEAIRRTYDDHPVFVLQGWLPREDLDRLQTYAAGKRLALEVEEPTPEETPPTLLRNSPALAIGQDLVTFYTTPNYWFSDPSIIVLFSFILFFAIIIFDAGYGLVLGLFTGLAWRRMGGSVSGRRFRILLGLLAGVSVIWGVLVGSYFGLEPETGVLHRLKLLNMNDYDAMMKVMIIIGAAHIMLSNLVEARRRGLSAVALGPLGWIAMITGGLMVWQGEKTAGYWIMGFGIAAVLLFTSQEGSLFQRVGHGMLKLTHVTGAFGDVLSYLRLFALGLATASLAVVFNNIAAQTLASVPGIGLLIALIILLIGHSLNFVLAITGALVHGLRLNFIEFFKWSVSEEGVPFRVFAKKEAATWIP